MDGIINIYKEKGCTSHDVAMAVRRLLKGEKTGHAGTLDPEAEGVLIVLVGKATKLSDYLTGGDKEYRADVKFGASTSTYDHTGETVETGEVNFTRERLDNAVKGFIGVQKQIPPMYSALKRNGRKLCDLARKGVTIEREPREITVYDMLVERFNGFDEAVLYIKCGKGTYVRSICHDLGQALGCGAHMTALTRTKSAGFHSEDSIRLGKLGEIFETSGKDGLKGVLVPIEKALEGYNKITVCAQAEKLLYNGAKIERKYLKNAARVDKLNVLFDDGGRLIGIYEPVNPQNGDLTLKPKTMLV